MVTVPLVGCPRGWSLVSLECSVFSQMNQLRSQQFIHSVQIRGLPTVSQALGSPCGQSCQNLVPHPGQGQRLLSEQGATELRAPGRMEHRGYSLRLGIQGPCPGLSSISLLTGCLIWDMSLYLSEPQCSHL